MHSRRARGEHEPHLETLVWMHGRGYQRAAISQLDDMPFHSALGAGSLTRPHGSGDGGAPHRILHCDRPPE
jgi:hypothetical protein